MRVVLRTFASLLLIGACRDSSAPSDRAPRLYLEEEFAISVPDSAPVIGVAGEDAGRLIAWSALGAYLLSTHRGPAALPIAFSGPPAGAAFGEDGVVEAVDPTGAVLHRATGGGERAGARLPAGLRVQQAVRTRFGWILAGVGDDGRFLIRPLDGAPWWVIRPDTLRGGVLPPYSLAPTADGVLLTEAEPPFRTWRVSTQGASDVFAPTGTDLGEPRGAQRWISASVVDVGDGLIQTLADLASDRRVMIVYDRDGREMRKTVLGVPMAFVGITHDRRHLIAVRNLGSAEVVLYRWRWGTHNIQGAEP